jgi:hypothetical protein
MDILVLFLIILVGVLSAVIVLKNTAIDQCREHIVSLNERKYQRDLLMSKQQELLDQQQKLLDEASAQLKKVVEGTGSFAAEMLKFLDSLHTGQKGTVPYPDWNPEAHGHLLKRSFGDQPSKD